MLPPAHLYVVVTLVYVVCLLKSLEAGHLHTHPLILYPCHPLILHPSHPLLAEVHSLLQAGAYPLLLLLTGIHPLLFLQAGVQLQGGGGGGLD